MKKVLAFYTLISVLALMSGCSGRGEEMREHLLSLEAANRADSVMRNDSLAEAVAAYFDRHGTPNERMRAYYMLGRTYFDLGELPRALKTYYRAVDCADTTVSDCDYKTLSRVHAQTAQIFRRQVQARSELAELQEAIKVAKKAEDMLMAIECLSKMAGVYDYLRLSDSAINVKEAAARQFKQINRYDRAVQSVVTIVPLLLEKGQTELAKKYLDDYDSYSGLFDEKMKIQAGYEVYYYIKGNYFIAVNKIDSAEMLFRKELEYGKDLNNQIAACRGLLDVFSKRGLTDSIAKYAKQSYSLNDSAYSLSEMENIQKLQASYNYNHAKLEAESNALRLAQLYILLLVLLVLILVAVFFVMWKYRRIRQFTLEYRLRNSDVVQRLREMARKNPPVQPSLEDWKQLRKLIQREIPSLDLTLNTNGYRLSDTEYDVCLLIRTHFSPMEVSKLKKCSPSYVSNIRKRLLLKAFCIDGRAEDFDEQLLKIKA